jgi:uncharacterized spore protein YtfJ
MTEGDARDQASRVMTGPGFIERLAERIGGAARASAVFGEAVESQGVTVIPVARARWGFGGGGGEREGQESEGGGGGTMVSPVGYIELRGGEARFRRIYGRAQIAAAAASFGLSGVIALRMARKRRERTSRPRPRVSRLMLHTAGMGVRFMRHRVRPRNR